MTTNAPKQRLLVRSLMPPINVALCCAAWAAMAAADLASAASMTLVSELFDLSLMSVVPPASVRASKSGKRMRRAYLKTRDTRSKMH